MPPQDNASSGHKLGQVIGDWFEEYFALPILKDICTELNLFVDSRFIERSCRTTEKLLWTDSDGNTVDYDYVFELGGDENQIGIPVAFFETFWRRGARHSKDKARDDTGKLTPMKSTYPTARVLGILAAGDFTAPACELVRSRNVDLYYVEKSKILTAWRSCGLEVDYADRSSEATKAAIANRVCEALENHPQILADIATSLKELVGIRAITSYKQRIIGKLGATPQRYTIYVQRISTPISFASYLEFEEFLTGDEPLFSSIESEQSYRYEVAFGDGDIFEGDNLSWESLKQRHEELKRLILHMESLT